MSESITAEMIARAAAAIANARGMRRGAPAITNILEILPEKLKAEVLEDAEEALKAGLVGSIFERLLNAEKRADDLSRALDLALDSDRQADVATAVAIRGHWARPEAPR